MTMARRQIPILSSIAGLAGSYSVWLCDIWGVMHNGETPFPDAVHACLRFRAEGGLVLLLSNSPRPSEPVMSQLNGIGVPDTAYDAIVTSGDATRNLMSEKPGQRVFHLGPERDRPLFEGLDVKLVDLEEAEYVLLSGLYDDLSETPDDYADLLAQIKLRGLAMICANPDLQVERGSRLIYCAGALGAAYEKIGGEVVYPGKPHKPIYDLALARIAGLKGAKVPRGEILCIGDGLRTDMAGAFAARMDALYVASALHIDGANSNTPLEASTVSALFRESGIKPVAAQNGLAW